MRNAKRVLGLSVALIVMLMFSTSVTVFAQDAIEPGTTIDGEYTGEPQEFTFSATAGQLLIIAMDSEDFDPLVRLMLAGEEIASDDDSGGSLNSLLVLVAPEDGDYSIMTDTFFFEGEVGVYSLSLDVVDPVMVAVGETVTLEPGAEGALQLYAVLDAAAGTVVDIAASVPESDDEEDIRLLLNDPRGEEIDRDDDDGPARNALLRRLELLSDGLYLITVEHAFSDTLVTQPVELSVTEMEPLPLTDTPMEVTLGDARGQVGTEILTFDATAGTTYRISATIEPVPEEEVGIQMEILDTGTFFPPELEVSDTTYAAWDFTPAADGTYRLDMHINFFSDDLPEVNYTMMIEEMAE